MTRDPSDAGGGLDCPTCTPPARIYPNLDSAYILERHTAMRNGLQDHLGQFPRLTHDLEKAIERIEDTIAHVEKLDAALGARLRKAFEGAGAARSASERLTDELGARSASNG